MSVHDKGGRNHAAWNNATPPSEAGGSRAAAPKNTSLSGPSSSGGYTPVEPPRSAFPASEVHHHAPIPASQPQTPASATPSGAAQPPATSPPEQSSSPTTTTVTAGAVTRVRALHAFDPTVAGELAFDKGDIIKVTDRAYDNWWRGQLRGRTGIFPVNYVVRLVATSPMNCQTA